MKNIFLYLIIFSMSLFAQTVYELPFASAGNQIELSVANTSSTAIENIMVKVEASPAWIDFNNCQIFLNEVESISESPALFKFSVDKRAPIGEEGRLIFQIKNLYGGEWRKEINIIVSKPVNYELTQNYPNPFNPSTKIEFVIPRDEKVTMKVFDILGREVKTLADDFLEAGHHEIEFNASQLASGTYIFRLTSGNYSQIKKMQLVK